MKLVRALVASAVLSASVMAQAATDLTVTHFGTGMYGVPFAVAKAKGWFKTEANRLLAARVSMADYQTMKRWLSTRLSGPDARPVSGQVDLTASRVELVDDQGTKITAALQVPDDMRQAILNPIDPIDQTLADRLAIDEFAAALFEAKPWLKGPDKGLFGL